MVNTLNFHILSKVCGFRCGIILPYQQVETTFSDIQGIFNISIPEDSVQPWKSATGSISRLLNRAITGAIGEAIERYCAAVISFPVKKASEVKENKIIFPHEFSLFAKEQYNIPGFPWKPIENSQVYFGEVYSIYDNQRFYVPQELIGLGPKSDKALFPSTSSGLAAHTNKFSALLLAVEECLERDALTVFWMNSLGGRQIDIDDKYINPVIERKGQVFCFDITQSWNPHPVIIVCGYLLQRNKKRISLGVACRPSYREAIEKAYLEWIQGAIFAGFFDLYNPDLDLLDTNKLIDFDQHAVYYTLYPNLWNKVPLIRRRKKYQKKETKAISSQKAELVLFDLLKKLNKENIRMFYRDLTLPDINEIGVKVIRVVSPELSLIHGDERSPFLGGRTNNVLWRYPDMIKEKINFPNKFPHPLG